MSGSIIDPYGTKKRKLDRLNLMNFKSSSDAPEKIIFQHTILDAANNYLFFGLSNKNGTSASEFWYAYEYFYRIRSFEPDTWKDCKCEELTDHQIKAMCFDIHFSISNIRLSMDTFLRWLKRERTSVIEENWNQINTYLTTLQPQNYDILNLLDISTKKRILISPESPEEVSQLISLRAAEDKKTKGIGGHGVGNKNIGKFILDSNI